MSEPSIAAKRTRTHPVAWMVLALLIGMGAYAIIFGKGHDERGAKPAPIPATEQLPALASFILPQSDIEKKLLADLVCVDESECYGFKRFDRDVLAQYPEISAIKFKVDPDLKGDAEAIAASRQDFHRGLYFAKQITLADGETLFQLLTSCAKPIAPPSGAQLDITDPKNVKIAMQFFPVFKTTTGEDFEMQILLDRQGEKIMARSPLFSTTILRYPNFMQRHGLKCWR